MKKKIQMYIIMKTAILMIAMMVYLLGNQFWQEDDSFADCEFHLYPSLGFCYHWIQCATLFTQSVNMNMLSLKN